MASLRLRRGLSLLELLAAISILAILTAATAWSLAPRLTNAKLNRVLDQIAELDHRARDLAERSGQPVVIEFRLRDNQLTIVGDGSPVSSTVKISSGLDLNVVQIGKQTTRNGKTELRFSRTGQSMNYGVLIESADKSVSRWLLVAGLTGQVLERKDARDARKILSLE